MQLILLGYMRNVLIQSIFSQRKMIKKKKREKVLNFSKG